MGNRRPALHRRLSIALACTGDDAEQLGLRRIARALYDWSFRVNYREWERKPGIAERGPQTRQAAPEAS